MGITIDKDCELRGVDDSIRVTGGAKATFLGTVEGDITVDCESTLDFSGTLLGRLVIEDGSSVTIDGIACEDNLPTDVDFECRSCLVPSGYRIVKI